MNSLQWLQANAEQLEPKASPSHAQGRLHNPCSAWGCRQRAHLLRTGLVLLPPETPRTSESWLWLSSPNSVLCYNKYANAKRMDSVEREWLTRHRGPEAEVREESAEGFSERHFREVMEHGAERNRGESVWRERVGSQFKLFKAHFSWTKIILMQIIVRYGHTEVIDNNNSFKNIFKNSDFY